MQEASISHMLEEGDMDGVGGGKMLEVEAFQ